MKIIAIYSSQMTLNIQNGKNGYFVHFIGAPKYKVINNQTVVITISNKNEVIEKIKSSDDLS